jgi:hypothetical protein
MHHLRLNIFAITDSKPMDQSRRRTRLDLLQISMDTSRLRVGKNIPAE